MNLALIITASVIGGIIIGVVIEHCFFRNNDNEDQNGETIIQNLIEKVDIIIEDIKKTV